MTVSDSSTTELSRDRQRDVAKVGTVQDINSNTLKSEARSIESKASRKSKNDLGILIDLSHANDATTSEAIDFSNKPVAITHSVFAAVHDHQRAVSDDNL